MTFFSSVEFAHHGPRAHQGATPNEGAVPHLRLRSDDHPIPEKGGGGHLGCFMDPHARPGIVVFLRRQGGAGGFDEGADARQGLPGIDGLLQQGGGQGIPQVVQTEGFQLVKHKGSLLLVGFVSISHRIQCSMNGPFMQAGAGPGMKNRRRILCSVPTGERMARPCAAAA